MTVWLEIEGKKRRVDLPAVTTGDFECAVDGRAIRVNARMLEPGVMSLTVDGRQYRCVLDGDGAWIGGRRYTFPVDDPRSLAGRRGAGSGAEGPRSVKAPMPGRVVRVLVEAGADVTEGQGVVVIEAMKMQNEVQSPLGGVVTAVHQAIGARVERGDLLIEYTPDG